MERLAYIDAITKCEEDIEKKRAKSGLFMFSRPSCMIGAYLPEFKASSFSGKLVTTSSLKGKVTVINFWFEACPPCIAEIPVLHQLTTEFDSEEVEFIAISSDSDNQAQDFLQTVDWDFHHLKDGSEIIKEVFHFSWGFPTTFVTDKNGMIVKAYGGVEKLKAELQAEIKNLL